jgi:hypothetical protein
MFQYGTASQLLSTDEYFMDSLRSLFPRVYRALYRYLIILFATKLFSCYSKAKDKKTLKIKLEITPQLPTSHSRIYDANWCQQDELSATRV